MQRRRQSRRGGGSRGLWWRRAGWDDDTWRSSIPPRLGGRRALFDTLLSTLPLPFPSFRLFLFAFPACTRLLEDDLLCWMHRDEEEWGSEGGVEDEGVVAAAFFCTMYEACVLRISWHPC